MTINDDNWMFLHNATGLSLTYNDMYAAYLRGLGYSGSLQDMIGNSGIGLDASRPSGGVPVGYSVLRLGINAGDGRTIRLGTLASDPRIVLPMGV